MGDEHPMGQSEEFTVFREYEAKLKQGGKVMSEKFQGYVNLALIVLDTEDVSVLLPIRESDTKTIDEILHDHLGAQDVKSVRAFFGLNGGEVKSLERIKRIMMSAAEKSAKLRIAISRLKRHEECFRVNLTRSGLEAKIEESQQEIINLKTQCGKAADEIRQLLKLLDVNERNLRCMSRDLKEAREQFIRDIFKADIEILELSIRATRCLRENGVNNITDLIRKTRDELLAFPQFGRKCLYETVDALSDAGLYLAKKPWVPQPQRPAMCLY